MSDEKKQRQARDPKALAQERVDVIDRKIERERKHLGQARAVVVGAEQAIAKLKIERDYAASHPALQAQASEPDAVADPFDI